MRTDLFTNPKKALIFAGAIVFGVVMLVDSEGAEDTFVSTESTYEYESPQQAAFFGGSGVTVAQPREEPEEETDDGDYGDEGFSDDTEGYDPAGEDAGPTTVIEDTDEVAAAAPKMPSPYVRRGQKIGSPDEPPSGF